MKKILILLGLASLSLSAAVPYFHRAHSHFPNYQQTNPFKSNQIEIYEWRAKGFLEVERALKKLDYKLISHTTWKEKSPSGHHTFFRKDFKPKSRTLTRVVDGDVAGTYKIQTEDLPLVSHGRLMKRLVVIYEKVNGKGMPTTAKNGRWICYNSYWEFDWMNWVSKKYIDNHNKVERLRSNREPFKGFDFGQ